MDATNFKIAIICAAGMGSRLGLDMPKCLVEVGGHKMIYYLLKQLADFDEVRVVVGFREEEVIKYVKSIRPDTVFVRNSDYSRTTNAYSLFLGTHDLKTSFITIDGDMIVDPASFASFVNKCQGDEIILGLAEAKTEDAVFVETDPQGTVLGFSRDPISKKEWSGIAFVPSPFKIRKEGKYVYQEMERYLPIQSSMIKCWEVDTPQDLNLVLEEVDFTTYG